MPRILATQATMPPMPAGGFDPEPLDSYLKALVMSLNADRVQVGDRIERRVLYGPTSGFPTARGGGDLYYDTTIGDLYIDTGTWDKVFSSVIAHTHDDRYYTETELDGGQLDNRYYTETEVDALLHAESHTIASHSDTTATGAELETLTNTSNADSLHSHNYAAASHNHDSRYYTESEVNSLLAGKANVSHTHDSRYYTESEIDTKLAAYLPLTAGSGKELTGSLYIAYPNGLVLENSSSQIRAAMGMSGDLMVIGSSDSETQIRFDGYLHLAGASGSYINITGVDDVYLTGALLDTEGGGILSGGANINSEGGNFIGTIASKLLLGGLDMCQVVSSQRIFGYTSGVSWFEGGNCRMYGPYKTGTADPPSTTQFSASSWGVYVNTSNGKCWFCYNNGGTMKRMELT